MNLLMSIYWLNNKQRYIYVYMCVCVYIYIYKQTMCRIIKSIPKWNIPNWKYLTVRNISAEKHGQIAWKNNSQT